MLDIGRYDIYLWLIGYMADIGHRFEGSSTSYSPLRKSLACGWCQCLHCSNEDLCMAQTVPLFLVQIFLKGDPVDLSLWPVCTLFDLGDCNVATQPSKGISHYCGPGSTKAAACLAKKSIVRLIQVTHRTAIIQQSLLNSVTRQSDWYLILSCWGNANITSGLQKNMEHYK